MLNYSNVDHEVAAGRLWRAKEILQGRLPSAGYDTCLYERYGSILLQLGDMKEAGKYLFLSGSRKPAYEQAIGIFIGRHANSINTLYGSFPAAVRGAAPSSYPACVLDELQALDFSLGRLQGMRQREKATESSWTDKAFGIGAVTLFLLLIFGFVVQSFRGLGWLWERISGA